MRLVASMIVRNEMHRYLPLAIEHLATFCDEIRVLDDGSSDGGYDILLAHPKVGVLTNDGPTFFEHEGMARQKLLQWTLEAEPDWVLAIDADEFVGDPELVRDAIETGDMVYTLQMEEVWRCDESVLDLRIDGQWGPRPCPILWRAPNPMPRRNSAWMIPQVALACGREPLAVRRTKAAHSGSSVLHFGWANRSMRQERAERYFEHDGGKFHRNSHLQSILWPDELVGIRHNLWPQGMTEMRSRIVEVANR